MDSKPCPKCGGTERYKDGDCAACAREYGRKWNNANRDKKRRNELLRHQANRDRLCETSRRRYQENAKRYKQSGRLWALANPEKRRLNHQRRRARKNGSEGSYTLEEWRTLCLQYDNKCLYPGCERTDLQADHIVPISKGGSSDISNIQPLCAHHNQSKKDKTVDYRHKPGVIRWIQQKLFG